LTERNSEDSSLQLEQDLARLQQYESLVDYQEKLIASGEFESLPQVLGKKTKVLSGIVTLRNGAAQARAGVEGRRGGKNARSPDELLAGFITKVEELFHRENASLGKALTGRAELAGQLQAIYHGKKLLRGYKPERSDGKARFKDIKT
jgi:hypothetical protein